MNWHENLKPSKPSTHTRHGAYSKSTYRKIIRKMCLHCCGNQAVEVKECPATDCPLWPARMGTTKPEEPTSKPYPKLDCI